MLGHKRSIISVLMVLLVFIIASLSFGVVYSITYKTNQTILFSVKPTLSMDISGDLLINNLVPGSYAYSNGLDMTVHSNAQNGFYVQVTAGSPDNNTTSLINTSTGDNYEISSIPEDPEIDDISEAEDNTWGFYYNNDCVPGFDYIDEYNGWTAFTGLPLDGDSTTSPKVIFNAEDYHETYGGNRPFCFKIGAKAGSDLPSGIYSNVINFYAISHPVSDLATIEDVEYMQEFATMSEGEKAIIKASMQPDKQYIIKDSRDEKEYYIARIKDGNIWMTQNLDHNIVTTENFYTSENTDLPWDLLDPIDPTPGVWNPIRATYATGDSTWGQSGPESYDPGNYCWNGTPGTYRTISCTREGANKHYALGNYYNWNTAVAANSISDFTKEDNVNQSICPAGWKLPNAQGDLSYSGLVETLALTSGTNGNVQDDPVYFVYGGRWTGSRTGASGYYESAYYESGNTTGRFYFSISSISPRGLGTRSEGYFVRCVAR